MYYIVTDNQNSKEPKQTLVRAKSKSEALSAVVQPRFSVVAASDDDLVNLPRRGVPVIEASEVKAAQQEAVTA